MSVLPLPVVVLGFLFWGSALKVTVAISSSEQQQGCLRGGGVDSMLRSEEQLRAQELQHDISCDKNRTARRLYLGEVRELYGLTAQNFQASVATYYNTLESCLTYNACDPGSEVTWCIHMYHPTEDITICLNESGVINETDYSKLLQLQCYFSVPSECLQYTHCIEIKQPEHLLDRAIMTCSVSNPETNCIARSYSILSVEVVGQEADLPRPEFDNRTELVLGETNLFLCTVYFTENRIYSGIAARWSIDGVPIRKIHESPFCFLESPEDCVHDSSATTRGNRTRAYEEELLVIPNCPVPIFFYREWLWIDNATEEDSQHTYNCAGMATFFNPFPRVVEGELNVTFTSVLPLLDVDVVLHPSHPNNPNRPANINETVSFNPDSPNRPVFPLDLTFPEGSGFQWPCSVTAGLGDELQWLFNDRLIASTNESLEELPCPDDDLGSLYFVSWPVEDLGGFSRGYNSTLIACGLSREFSTGLYRCQLSRSLTRNDPVMVWSATISFPPSATATLDTPVDDRSAIRDLIIGVACAAFVAVVVFVLAIVVACVVVCQCRKRKRSRERLDLLAFTNATIVHMDMDGAEHKRRELVKETSLQCVSDPMEFPRNKLVVSNKVLGEGCFCQVIEGRAEEISKDPRRNRVALKTCRDNAPQHEFDGLWEELQLMKKLGPHENIVILLGQCTVPPGPLYLILEFAEHGNLKNYLHQCKEVVEKLNHAPQIASGPRLKRHPSVNSNRHPSVNSSRHASASSFYHAHAQHEKIPLSQQSSVFSVSSRTSRIDSTDSSSPDCPKVCTPRGRYDSGFCGESAVRKVKGSVFSETAQDYVNCKGLLYMEDVLGFGLQIARGLQHLESLKVAHCDLAARNILIADGFELKIGDFGMAWDMADGREYNKDKQDRLPVKWLAPEVIQEDGTITHKSDIWSFGIVLWEIFTYGDDPYRNQKISYTMESFKRFLQDGNRLARPQGCPDNIYDFMMKCWHLCPDKRPSAGDLVQFLENDYCETKDDETKDDETKDDEAISMASEEPITPTLKLEQPSSPARESQV